MAKTQKRCSECKLSLLGNDFVEQIGKIVCGDCYYPLHTKNNSVEGKIKTQKERLKEAYAIHSSAHHWMGYLICDGEDDLLCFRKWVLKREREAVKLALNKEAIRRTSIIERGCKTCNHVWNYTGNHCLKCGEAK